MEPLFQTHLVWVAGLSGLAGVIKFLNEDDFKQDCWLWELLKDVLTGILSGFMMFWSCQYLSIPEQMTNVAICAAGLMGIRALDVMKTILTDLFARK